MAGRHGSSWHSLLQMFTAHCQTSMQSRVTTARNILEDYEMEERTGHLVDTDRVHPDLGILRLAISQGKYAVQNNQSGYNSSALSGGQGGSLTLRFFHSAPPVLAGRAPA